MLSVFFFYFLSVYDRLDSGDYLTLKRCVWDRMLKCLNCLTLVAELPPE